MKQRTKHYLIALLAGLTAGWVVDTAGTLVLLSMSTREVSESYFETNVIEFYGFIMFALVAALVFALLSWKDET